MSFVFIIFGFYVIFHLKFRTYQCLSYYAIILEVLLAVISYFLPFFNFFTDSTEKMATKMEWTEDHDILLLLAELCQIKKGSPDGGKIWESIQER